MKKLKSELLGLDKQTLKKFYDAALEHHFYDGMLFTQDSFKQMRNEINRQCRVVNALIPIADTDEFYDLVESKPCYFFAYLDATQIVDILCRYINKHLDFAKRIARDLKDNSNVRVRTCSVWNISI